ncbi:hypothetical protein WDV76_07090 [Xenorhabdus griffiniae]|uniref:hypothetical protein n=1 Tax=Xenorhabdus griffiniae TaxID=351672 RepID=UPI0030CB42B2
MAEPETAFALLLESAILMQEVADKHYTAQRLTAVAGQKAHRGNIAKQANQLQMVNLGKFKIWGKLSGLVKVNQVNG